MSWPRRLGRKGDGAMLLSWVDDPDLLLRDLTAEDLPPQPVPDPAAEDAGED
jgi:hypothetical protein